MIQFCLKFFMPTSGGNIYSLLAVWLVLVLGGCDGEIKRQNLKLGEDLQASLSKEKAAEIQLTEKSASLAASHERLVELKAENDQLNQKLSNCLQENASLKAKIEAEESANRSQAMIVQNLQKEIDGDKVERARIANEKANEKGEIVGNVAYFFNDNFGYKPDVGAQAYIWKKEAYPEFNPEVFSNWLKSNSAEVVIQMSNVMDGKSTVSIAADGNGSFRKKVSPGEYYIIVRSAHRKNLSFAEMVGKLMLTTVQVSANDEGNVDAKFEAY